MFVAGTLSTFACTVVPSSAAYIPQKFANIYFLKVSICIWLGSPLLYAAVYGSDDWMLWHQAL